MPREVELPTQGHTSWQSWCWVLDLLFSDLVPIMANRKKSGLHIGINQLVTNIHQELAHCRRCERHFTPGVLSWGQFCPDNVFLIVQNFYLNLKFSKLIKTNYQRDWKIKTQTPFRLWEPCVRMAVEPVTPVQLAWEYLVENQFKGH